MCGHTLAKFFFILRGENTDWSATIWCLRTNSKLLLSINIISSYLSDLSNVPDLILLRIIVHVTYFSSVFAVLNCQTRKVAFIVSNLTSQALHTSKKLPYKAHQKTTKDRCLWACEPSGPLDTVTYIKMGLQLLFYETYKLQILVLQANFIVFILYSCC